ncbi:MAG: fimbrial assembly protein [Gallionella sp.]|nr:fimbrial assembly protein [Gallionella sp.]
MSQQINLFNPIFLRQQKMFSLLTMVQALGLIVLGSGFFYGYAQYQVTQLTRQSEESDQRFKVGQASLTRYTSEFSPQQANKLLQDEVQNLEQQNTEQAKVVSTLKSGEVGNTTGYSAYMQAFSRQVIEGLWLTGFSVLGDGAHMTLSGGVLRAELLPAYIQRLNNEVVIQGKTFSKLQMQQPVVDDAKVAEQMRARIAAQVAAVENDWRIRQSTKKPITPEEFNAYQQALIIAKTPSKQPIHAGYIEFSLQSEEDDKQKTPRK